MGPEDVDAAVQVGSAMNIKEKKKIRRIEAKKGRRRRRRSFGAEQVDWKPEAQEVSGQPVGDGDTCSFLILSTSSCDAGIVSNK